MERSFQGFSPQTAEFFMGLALNNNKAYFEAEKDRFKRFVQEPLLALARDLEPLMLDTDPEFETRAAQGKALARIRKDTRFTRDKSPYRCNLWLGYRRSYEGNTECLGFYFDVSAHAVSWGMGMYAPYRLRMDELRKNILKAPGAFLALTGQPRLAERFTLEGEHYRRPLIKEGDPAVLDWCNRKYAVLVHEEPFGAQAFSPALGRAVEDDFSALAPLYRLLRGMPPRNA